MEEIKARTQGRTETIGIYLATMENLFTRLTSPLSESDQLKILQRNILPFYQDRLALVDINSKDELLRFCRKLESKKVYADSFRSPQSSSQVKMLEPDLSYVEVKDNKCDMICFACKKPGHIKRNCKAIEQKPKQQLKCFRCGKVGFTTKTCPNCKGNQSKNASSSR